MEKRREVLFPDNGNSLLSKKAYNMSIFLVNPATRSMSSIKVEIKVNPAARTMPSIKVEIKVNQTARSSLVKGAQGPQYKFKVRQHLDNNVKVPQQCLMHQTAMYDARVHSNL